MKKEDVMKRVEEFVTEKWKSMAKLEINICIKDTNPDRCIRQYQDINVVMD